MSGFNFPSDNGFNNGCAPPWVRDANWLPMPASTTDTIHILARIEDSLDNTWASIDVASTNFSIDWGDGVVEAFVGAGVRSHEYTYATAPVNDGDAVLGHKQAMVTITGVAAITSFSVANRPGTFVGNFCQPWLDFQVNAPSCTNMITYDAINSIDLMQRFIITEIGDIVSLYNVFNSHRGLREIAACDNFGAHAVNMISHMQSMPSLTSFVVGPLYGSVATNMSNHMYNLYSLISFVVGPLYGSVATNMSNHMYNLFALISFVVGPLYGSVATNMSNYMYNLYSLTSFSPPTAWGQAATTGSPGPFLAKSLKSLGSTFSCKQNFSIVGSSIGRNEFNKIISSLPSGVQTITLTGTPASSKLTVDDIAAATAKSITLVL